MAYGLSTYLANALLNHAFRNVAYTPPASIWGKIHIGDPGAAGTANASTQTTRLQTTFGTAAIGIIQLSNLPEFTLNATETIVAMSFWDASTNGNFLFSCLASIQKGGVSGDIIRLATETISLAPLAA